MLLKKVPKKRFHFAPIIVTDFSWGIINSAMETFNNCTVIVYINWCFDILFHNENSIIIANVMKTIFCLCAVHFLKLIISKVRKIKKFQSEENNKKIQNAFIFAFTLLQNATTVEDFSTNLKYVYSIFNSRHITKDYLLSEVAVKAQLINRNSTVISLENEMDEDRYKYVKSKEHMIIIDDDFCENSLKQSSPFKIYFDKLIKQHAKNIKISEEKKENIKNNFYFCPEMFNILIDYIYIIPFWNGIILNHWKLLNPSYKSSIKARLDNNPVENHIKQIKNCLFSSLPLMPSQYTSQMKTRLNALCIENYKLDFENIKLNTQKHISDAIEPWGEKRKTSRNRKQKMFSFYEKPSSIFENPKGECLIKIHTLGQSHFN